MTGPKEMYENIPPGNSNIKVLLPDQREHSITINKESALLACKDIFEWLPHPLIIIKADDFSVYYANRAAKAGKEDIAETCFKLNHNSDKPCHDREQPCSIELLRKSRDPVVLESSCYNKLGELVPVNIHAWPILGDDGELIYIVEYIVEFAEPKRDLAKREIHEKIIGRKN